MGGPFGFEPDQGADQNYQNRGEPPVEPWSAQGNGRAATAAAAAAHVRVRRRWWAAFAQGNGRGTFVYGFAAPWRGNAWYASANVFYAAVAAAASGPHDGPKWCQLWTARRIPGLSVHDVW